MNRRGFLKASGAAMVAAIVPFAVMGREPTAKAQRGHWAVLKGGVMDGEVMVTEMQYIETVAEIRLRSEYELQTWQNTRRLVPDRRSGTGYAFLYERIA